MIGVRAATSVTDDDAQLPVAPPTRGYGPTSMSDFSSPPPPPPPLSPPPPGMPQYTGGPGYQPPQRLGKATAAMVCGIIGILILNVVLGPIAIVLGIMARKEIDRSNGLYTNRGQATAGLVCGIIAVCLIPVTLLIFLG